MSMPNKSSSFTSELFGDQKQLKTDKEYLKDTADIFEGRSITGIRHIYNSVQLNLIIIFLAILIIIMPIKAKIDEIDFKSLVNP